VVFERAMPSLGAAWEYWYASTSWMWAWKIWKESNFIWKLYAALGNNLPFHAEVTSGGTNLRGYRNRQYRGDFKASNTMEFSVPLFKIGSVAFRALAFWDSAYTGFVNNAEMGTRDYLPGQTDEEISRWRNGVGGGFRIYMRSIVLPLLGLDWGYGIETGEWQMYFAVGLTEL
jgi:outer membrane protein assembly factor BamA